MNHALTVARANMWSTILRHAVENEYTVVEIAKHTDLAPVTVLKYLGLLGLTPSAGPTDYRSPMLGLHHLKRKEGRNKVVLLKASLKEPTEAHKVMLELYEQGHSLEQIGTAYQLSRERIRQILEKFFHPQYVAAQQRKRDANKEPKPRKPRPRKANARNRIPREAFDEILVACSRGANVTTTARKLLPNQKPLSVYYAVRRYASRVLGPMEFRAIFPRTRYFGTKK